MKKNFIRIVSLAILFMFLGGPTMVGDDLDLKEREIPQKTGTIFDIEGADPQTFKEIDNAQKRSFGFLEWLLDYSQERFWATWDWFIEFLKGLAPWYTEQQETVDN
jgi:hypothetical protein